MFPTIMATDGGPHSAAKWANLTGERLLPIDDPRIPEAERISAERRPAALRLQGAIVEALMPHHADVQDAERTALATSNDRLQEAHDAANAGRLDRIIADIRKAAEGTPWQAHFWDLDVEAAIRAEVASHLVTIQREERSWHCDRNPGLAQALAYRAA